MKDKPDDSVFASVDECYRALQRGGAARASAEQLLSRRHWIHEVADFDEATGEMLASPLSHVGARLRDSIGTGPAASFKDRVYRILEHARGPLQEILRRLHEGLVREHAALPIQAVRELDTASFFALSRRPGRTIREKLADKPSLWAVQRRWTVDTAENRLVKALCVRLADLLRMRESSLKHLDEPWVGDLFAGIESWLHSSAAQEIGRWENLPPNNLLLQHRDYRRVWDAWRWAEALDDDTRRDHELRLAQWTTILFWSIVVRLSRSAGVRLLEQPCYPDYEDFALVPGRTVTTARASVEGLMCGPPPSWTCGVVSNLEMNRNAEGFGIIGGAGGAPVFFHSRMFSKPADFAGIRVGTTLAFELLKQADGKLRAARPWRLPGEIRVQLEGVRITLCPPVGATLEMTCAEDSQSVRVRVGSRSIAVDMSPEGADEAAKIGLSAAFGVRGELSAPGSPATELPNTHAASMRVVDLCSLRPRFAAGDQRGTLPFRLLWQRWHLQGREPVDIDLGNANAIALGGDVTSVSVLDLLAAVPVHPAALLGEAARSFAGKLKHALHGGSLTYIVPDATDEFALGTLRRNVNAAFRVAEPLPRSIAAVFAWQSSATFATGGVADGDCVLVLDTVGETLSATPLIARKSKELELRVTEGAGIYWERCPCVQSSLQTTSTETAVGVLRKVECSFPEEISRLCGLQGLVDEGCDVSWQNDAGVWHTAPHDQDQAVKHALLGLQNPWAKLAPGLEQELGRLATRARVFILLAGDIFRGPSPREYDTDVLRVREVVHVGHAHEPHRGAIVLHRWQERAGDIPLWRDRLPELSMRIIQNGRHARFYLVKDVTVSPRRGWAKSIDIEETFVLPAGLPDYRFPLLQGAEGSELHYEAFLSSPGFPLKEDLPVALRLTYSYGTDTPYDLVFTPLKPEPGGMTSVRAEWRPRADAEELPSLFPTMPVADPWAKFEQYPRKEALGTRNLLEWIRNQFDLLSTHAKGLDGQRQRAIVSSEWLTTKDEQRYVNADCEGRRVFCRESDFVDWAEAARVCRGDTLWLDVVDRARGSVGRRISASPRTERKVVDLKVNGVCGIMESGLRPSLLTVWSHGHSLLDPEAPTAFHEVIAAGTKTLLSLRQLVSSAEWRSERPELAHRISDASLLLLCCVHRDAPSEVADTLMAAFPGEGASPRPLLRYCRHMGLALGACEEDWQRSLFKSVLAQLSHEPVQLDACSICLRSLGIALWRCDGLLGELTAADLVLVVDRANLVLKEDLSRMSNRAGDVDPDVLKDHLELVLGLLRTRGSEDADLRGILAPGKPAAKALARTVEKIVDVVSAREVPIRSRITLNVDKPQALDKTPDLLYALKLYLTGDAGARAIRVMAVNEDED